MEQAPPAFHRPSLFKKTPHDFGIANYKDQGYVESIYEESSACWDGYQQKDTIVSTAKPGATPLIGSPGRAFSINAITIREDRSGSLWVRTYDQGLLHFDGRTGQIKTYPANPADPNS